ncbi:MAG: thymidylate synthase [Mariprofundaceae bacterium]|nr:thymidylate synthase [Mariprofundaceae bacterium]
MCRIGFFLLLILLMPAFVSAAAITATDKVVERFMELDYNQSETVSLDEYKSMVMGRMKKRFAQMDKNRDGQVSEDEYRKFWLQQKSQYYRPRR